MDLAVSYFYSKCSNEFIYYWGVQFLAKSRLFTKIKYPQIIVPGIIICGTCMVPYVLMLYYNMRPAGHTQTIGKIFVQLGSHPGKTAGACPLIVRETAVVSMG